MNDPKVSKINWTAGLMAVVGILVATGRIPPELEDHIVTLGMIGGPALIWVFRTWFTHGRPNWWLRLTGRL